MFFFLEGIAPKGWIWKISACYNIWNDFIKLKVTLYLSVIPDTYHTYFTEMQKAIWIAQMQIWPPKISARNKLILHYDWFLTKHGRLPTKPIRTFKLYLFICHTSFTTSTTSFTFSIHVVDDKFVSVIQPFGANLFGRLHVRLNQQGSLTHVLRPLHFRHRIKALLRHSTNPNLCYLKFDLINCS